jgi:hypothetical protein
MKNIFYLLILTFIFISCETEEMSEHIEARDTAATLAKIGSNVPAVLSFQEHQDILARNSFIIGEVLRMYPETKQHIINSIDPITGSVSMQNLLNTSSGTLFYDHYFFIARYASMNTSGCRHLWIVLHPDEGIPWPPKPRNPPSPFDTRTNNDGNLNDGPTTGSCFTTLDFINKVINNNTEIVIYNPLSSGDIFTVGHPLYDQSIHLGSKVIKNVIITYTGRGDDTMFCGTYSEPATVSASNQAAHNIIVLSRPNLSNGNPYPYINFDITDYLDQSPPDEIPAF